MLEPNGDYKFRQQVKSDSTLPAYCNPPNPCPKGYTGRLKSVWPLNVLSTFQKPMGAKNNLITQPNLANLIKRHKIVCATR
jgi:hypothetical protein